MLNIYHAGEACDKTKFIFDHIDPDQQTIILVPDQASLQMERDALAYSRENYGRAALLNLMVADFSSLGRKVIREQGGRQPELIDKYGRQMLLSVLIDRLADGDGLSVYKSMKGKTSFVSNTNQLISEMKRSGVTSSDIERAAGQTDSYLQLKLSDICKIYKTYEDAIADRFTDSEDYIRFYGKLMEESELVQSSVIWITGFDTFTPLNMEVIQSLLTASKQVNIMMTWDGPAPGSADGRSGDAPALTTGDAPALMAGDARILTTGGGEGLFDLTAYVMDTLEELAAAAGTDCRRQPAECAPRHSIWNAPDCAPAERITLVQATNIFAEADRAAAFITELVRDKGFRYQDIAVICNDMDVRGGVLKRTFERWSIPAFADRKRGVLHQPVVRFLLSFLKVLSDGYQGEAVMELISTGLLGFSRRDEELLNNYVTEAKIRGTKWKKPFTWEGKNSFGAGRYSEDLDRLNEMRSFLVDTIEDARDEIGKRNTAEEKILGLTRFLEGNFRLLDRIEELAERQTRLGLLEGAAETAQSWEMICSIFTQVIRVIGESNISNRQLTDILTEGLREMEIGLVPPTADSVIIGTLQRTRLSKCPVLIVTGANEGVLPMAISDSGLLTEKELDTLEELKYSIAKKDEVRRQEEQLAIYRMFSLPSEQLIVMCSLADQNGGSMTPSAVFSVLKEMDGVSVLRDLGQEDPFEMIASRQGSLTFMADAMQEYMENGQIAAAWLAALDWYEHQDPDSIRKIMQGMDFDNRVGKLEKDFADSLYFGDKDYINMSASKLEVYTSCPFKYFIERGLRAEEPSAFETSGGSRGEVFHRALQVLSSGLTDQAKAAHLSVTDSDSPWMTITQEECAAQIEKIIREETVDYREGVYLSDNEATLQLERIIDTCSEIAWAMIGQVRKSRIKDMFFEEPFGAGSRRLPAVTIQLDNGKRAVLSGVIDRLDVLDLTGGDATVTGDIAAGDTSAGDATATDAAATGDTSAGDATATDAATEALRVIDYKTGSETVDLEQIREGYKLQLMVYMNVVEQSATKQGATEQGTAEQGTAEQGAGSSLSSAKPAGTFYFKIKELDDAVKQDANTDALGENVEGRVANACRLEGILVSDERIITSMDTTLEPKETSTVLPIKRDKDNVIKETSAGKLLSEEEFNELCRSTMDHVRRICREIQSGHIGIEPKKEKGTSGLYTKTSCTYCAYKSICLFDTSFRNCRYQLV